jgi:hypothetical protein
MSFKNIDVESEKKKAAHKMHCLDLGGGWWWQFSRVHHSTMPLHQTQPLVWLDHELQVE